MSEKNTPNTTPLHSELKKIIRQKNLKKTLQFLKQHHEADIAEALETLSKREKNQFFNHTKPEIAVEVLEEMSLIEQLDLINSVKIELATKFIEEMEPDDAADLIEELKETDEEKAETIIKKLPSKEAHDIIELISYPENSAGAIMTPEFLSIPEALTIEETLKILKKQSPPDSEVSFYIFIVDKQKKLVGYTTLRSLVFNNSKKTIREIRNDYPIKVLTTTDQEDVAKMFQKYDLVALPVVNEYGTLVGLITVDDIVDVVVEEATEDIFKLSGTSEVDEDKLTSGTITHSLISRIPWLILTVTGGILASYIITHYSTLFNPSLFPLALSLSFIPLLMGLGGNVGNQSATIIVRSIAIGHYEKKNPLHYILRESFIGLLIGSVLSSILFLFNLAFTHYSLLFISIVSFSLVMNIFVATLIGAALPILFNKCKIDPAVASAPFISTTLDITGQLIYFSITLFLIQQVSM